MRMVRSVLAVVAGFVAMAVGVMALFALAFQDPPDEVSSQFMAVAAFWGLCMAVAGGFLTAALAPLHAMKHVIALAALVALMSVGSMLTSSGQEPLWFQAANLVAGVVGVYVGGRLRAAVLRGARESG